MGSGKVIAFHSYKGGTGKTTCIVNLAAYYASKGNKVCLFDFDVYAPSFVSYFDEVPEYYIHNLLAGESEIQDVLIDYSSEVKNKGVLKIGFSSPRKDDIHSIELNSDNNSQLRALRNFLAVKKQLIIEEEYDYVFIDTSPGIRYWSINALATTDLLFIMLKLNEMDIRGTKKMIEEIYESLARFGLDIKVILNKVPGAHPYVPEPASLGTDIKNIEQVLKLPISMSIPCFCDIQFNRREYLWSITNPDHPFSKKIHELPDLLSNNP